MTIPAAFQPAETVLAHNTVPGSVPPLVFYAVPNYERKVVPPKVASDPRMWPPECHAFQIMRWSPDRAHELVCGFPTLAEAKLYLEWVVLYRSRRTLLCFPHWCKHHHGTGQ